MNRADKEIKNIDGEKSPSFLLPSIGACISQGKSRNSVQPVEGNNFKRIKSFRKTQLNSNNLYEKKFYKILLHDIKIKFKPQFIIYPYIVDILILSKGLIIEIDGTIHNLKKNQIKDEKREEYLRSFGLFITRYTSSDKTPIYDFLKSQLSIFPDINKKSIRKIRSRINRINGFATNSSFKFNTTESCLENLINYRDNQRIKNIQNNKKIKINYLSARFPKWAKEVGPRLCADFSKGVSTHSASGHYFLRSS